MRHYLISIFCLFIISCGKINTSPEFFKPDDKCYVVVESSVSLNQQFKEFLKEALKDKKNGIEESNLKNFTNYDGIQNFPEKFTYSSGAFTYNNGDKYEGEWKEEKRHGQGSYTWANGEKYVGEFKDGKFNGQGSFTFPEGGELEGHKYEGEWKDDKKNGQGIYFFPDGGKLVGEFRKDSPWNITDYDKNGKIKGKYVNGVRQ